MRMRKPKLLLSTTKRVIMKKIEMLIPPPDAFEGFSFLI